MLILIYFALLTKALVVSLLIGGEPDKGLTSLDCSSKACTADNSSLCVRSQHAPKDAYFQVSSCEAKKSLVCRNDVVYEIIGKKCSDDQKNKPRTTKKPLVELNDLYVPTISYHHQREVAEGKTKSTQVKSTFNSSRYVENSKSDIRRTIRLKPTKSVHRQIEVAESKTKSTQVKSTLNFTRHIESSKTNIINARRTVGLKPTKSVHRHIVEEGKTKSIHVKSTFNSTRYVENSKRISRRTIRLNPTKSEHRQIEVADGKIKSIQVRSTFNFTRYIENAMSNKRRTVPLKRSKTKTTTVKSPFNFTKYIENLKFKQKYLEMHQLDPLHKKNPHVDLQFYEELDSKDEKVFKSHVQKKLQHHRIQKSFTTVSKILPTVNLLTKRRINSKVKSSKIRVNSTVKLPQIRVKSTVKLPQIRVKSTVKLPQIRVKSTVKLPQIRVNSTVKLPQIRVKSTVKLPKIRLKPTVTSTEKPRGKLMGLQFKAPKSTTFKSYVMRMSTKSFTTVSKILPTVNLSTKKRINSKVKSSKIRINSTVKLPQIRVKSTVKLPQIRVKSTVKLPQIRVKSTVKLPKIRVKPTVTSTEKPRGKLMGLQFRAPKSTTFKRYVMRMSTRMTTCKSKKNMIAQEKVKDRGETKNHKTPKIQNAPQHIIINTCDRHKIVINAGNQVVSIQKCDDYKDHKKASAEDMIQIHEDSIKRPTTKHEVYITKTTTHKTTTESDENQTYRPDSAAYPEDIYISTTKKQTKKTTYHSDDEEFSSAPPFTDGFVTMPSDYEHSTMPKTESDESQTYRPDTEAYPEHTTTNKQTKKTTSYSDDEEFSSAPPFTDEFITMPSDYKHLTTPKTESDESQTYRPDTEAYPEHTTTEKETKKTTSYSDDEEFSSAPPFTDGILTLPSDYEHLTMPTFIPTNTNNDVFTNPPLIYDAYTSQNDQNVEGLVPGYTTPQIHHINFNDVVCDDSPCIQEVTEPFCVKIIESPDKFNELSPYVLIDQCDVKRAMFCNKNMKFEVVHKTQCLIDRTANYRRKPDQKSISEWKMKGIKIKKVKRIKKIKRQKKTTTTKKKPTSFDMLFGA